MDGLVRVGAVRLPSWDPRDPPKQWLEKRGDIAQGHGHWYFALENFPHLQSFSNDYFALNHFSFFSSVWVVCVVRHKVKSVQVGSRLVVAQSELNWNYVPPIVRKQHMIYAHICAICMSAYRCIYICILIVSSIWMNEQIPPEAHDRFCGYCRLSGMRALINMLIYIYILSEKQNRSWGCSAQSTFNR